MFSGRRADEVYQERVGGACQVHQLRRRGGTERRETLHRPERRGQAQARPGQGERRLKHGQYFTRYSVDLRLPLDSSGLNVVLVSIIAARALAFRTSITGLLRRRLHWVRRQSDRRRQQISFSVLSFIELTCIHIVQVGVCVSIYVNPSL